jgi:cell division protein FtsI (penicillin-binding protein 3)
MPDNNESKEMTNLSNRILLTYSIFVFAFLLLAGGIVYSTVKTAFVNKNTWLAIAKKAEEKLRPDVESHPNRGNIYSSDDRLMVTSFPRYKIYMDFSGAAFDDATFNGKLREGRKSTEKNLAFAKRNSVDSLAFYLSKKIGGNPGTVKNNLLRARREKTKRYPVHAGRISYPELKEIEQYPFFRLGRYASGKIVEEFVERRHPFGSLASRTIGHVYATIDTASDLTRARNGLELQYDSLLRGKTGKNAQLRIGGATRMRPIIPAEDGMDVYTTIDVNLQDIVERSLLRELKRTEAQSGTVALMDVKTGQIKAITNMARNSTGGYDETMNFAVSDMSEPGSTFKVASIMIALEDGICTSRDMVETGNGTFKYGNSSPITDHRRGGFGTISVEKVIWNSSNIGTAKVILNGYEKEPEKYIAGLERIGILEDMHLEIPGYGIPKIRRPGDRLWNKTDLMTMSYGYASQIPPIYTLAFYNAIDNDGKMVRPHFTRKIMKGGEIVQKFSTEVIREAICSERTLRTIQKMLIGVVDSGTGNKAKSNVIRIAGKTGTARLVDGKTYQGGHQVSFAGYFPADNPMYSCIVVIRKPSSAFPPSGGLMAGVVTKEIAERVYANRMHFDIRKVTADSTVILTPTPKAGELKATQQVLRKLDIKTEKKNIQSAWIAAKSGEHKVILEDRVVRPGLVPNVVGMGAKDAVYLLEKAGLRVNLSGRGRVNRQSVPAGKEIVKGQTIALSLL